jgi:serine phosphatase RsbU (regulator of sigma subunit)/CHASE2 domain-containing sensor protein
MEILREWRARAWAGAAATIAALLFYAVSPEMLRPLEFAAYRMSLPLRAVKFPSAVPVIVDIDERSLNTVRQWPWPRYLVADLVDALNSNGVAAVAFDVLFSERDNSSPREMAKYLKLDKNFSVRFEGLPDNFHNYEELFAASLAAAPAVLAVYAGTSALPPGGVPDTVNVIERASPGAVSYVDKLFRADGGAFPVTELENVPLGVVNVEPDADGSIRRIPVVVSIGGKIYPTLSLRALMVALGTRNLIIGTGSGGIEYVKISRYTMRVSPDGFIHIPFIGPQHTYEYVSAADVLAGTVARERLEGRVAMVGSSAPGLSDIHPMPYDSAYPGLETHAAVLDAMLSGNSITVPASAGVIQGVMILAAGALSTLLFGFARPRVYVSVAAALAAAIVFFACVSFARGIFLSPIPSMMTVALTAVSILFLRFIQEERQKMTARAALAEENARRAREQADLDAARKIQDNALTKEFPPYEGFLDAEVFAVMRPAKDVGGDFYDCFSVGEGRLVVVIADVSGKGIPAALFMMMARTVIRSQAMSGFSAGEILRAANDLLSRDNNAAMFVTVFIAIYDRASGTLEYANAGHNSPIIIRGGELSWLSSEENFVLGGYEGLDYEQESVDFRPGDCLALYTDGVTEAMNEANELFGDDRLMETVRHAADLPAKEIVVTIDAEVARYAGTAGQSDDVTVIVLRLTSTDAADVKEPRIQGTAD